MRPKELLENSLLLVTRNLRHVIPKESKVLFLESLIQAVCVRISILNTRKKRYESRQRIILKHSFAFQFIPKHLYPSYLEIDNIKLSFDRLISKLYVVIYVIERELHNLLSISPKETVVSVQKFDYALIEQVFDFNFKESKGTLKVSLNLLKNEQETVSKLINWLNGDFEGRTLSYQDIKLMENRISPFFLGERHRNILSISTLVAFLLSVVTKISTNYQLIQESALNGTSWLDMHLAQPMISMFQQIFMDGVPETVIEYSVEDASNSLKRMISNITNVPLSDTIDLSSIFRTKYENEIQKPITNLLFGDLKKLVLIQIQFFKLQALTAMTQINSILRDNKFNAQVLAVLPGVGAIFVLFAGFQTVYSYLTNQDAAILNSRTKYERLLLDLGIELFFECSNEFELKINEGKITYLVLSICEEMDSTFSFGLDKNQKLKMDILQKLLLRNGKSRPQQQKIYSTLLKYN